MVTWRAYILILVLLSSHFSGGIVAAPARDIYSVEGTLRRRAKQDLLLETSSGRLLRFRLVAATEFRGPDDKPYRDSLLNPGDRVAVNVSLGDTETAVYVIFIRSGTASEHRTGSAVVEENRAAIPVAEDFVRPIETVVPDNRLSAKAESGHPIRFEATNPGWGIVGDVKGYILVDELVVQVVIESCTLSRDQQFDWPEEVLEFNALIERPDGEQWKSVQHATGHLVRKTVNPGQSIKLDPFELRIPLVNFQILQGDFMDFVITDTRVRNGQRTSGLVYIRVPGTLPVRQK